MPSLWKDVFQKVKALGYTGVSFYVDWALLEGMPGIFRAEGNFDLGPFFDAASEAGIYLLARPGKWNLPGSGSTCSPLCDAQGTLSQTDVHRILTQHESCTCHPLIYT